MPIENFKLYNTPDETLKQWARSLNYLLGKNLDNSNIASVSSTAFTLSALQVKASHIDFGVGANQVDASDILITDASSYYAGGSVEVVLQEIGSTIRNFPAENIKISDAGLYYVSTSVEGALQEIGSTIRNFPAENIKINDTGGYYTSTSVEGAFQEIGPFVKFSTTIGGTLSTIITGSSTLVNNLALNTDLITTNSKINDIRQTLINFGILTT